MNIALKTLKLKNFKGIKDLTINFSKVTNISGENATGKTSIFDSFTWLLFDKDSQDRSKFDVQPLDENNNIIHMIDTEVEGILDINGVETTLKKVLKEKWVKKRGEVESELKGTETSYYVNEVPVKQGEYKKKISEIVDENLFKLLTNPLYFSTVMKWQDRRGIILKFGGDLTDDRVIASNEKLKDLAKLLNNTSIDDLKKATAAKKKKLMDDKKSIPYRVDELNNSIKDHDFDSLDFQARHIKGELKVIEDKLMDSSKAGDERLQEQQKLFNLKSKLNELENEARREAEKPKETLKNELFAVNSELTTLGFRLSSEQRETETNRIMAEKIEKELVELREKFVEVQNTPFEIDESQFVCPTCKRPLEADNVNEMVKQLTENHNQNISRQLASVRAEGQRKAEELKIIKSKADSEGLKTIQDNISIYEARKKELEQEISDFKPLINLDAYNNQVISKQIEEIEEKLQNPIVDNGTQELKNKRAELQSELEQLNKTLAFKDTNQKTKERIAELLEEEKALAQKIADLEKTEYLCEEFIKAKVNLLESSINNKFKYVKFKLFETQVNGGVNECCEALIDGVPFSNANKAAQYNSGIDIINALSDFYGIQAPIFIDNRESVNQLIESNSQIVNLLVSKDKPLKIETDSSSEVSQEDKEYFDKKIQEIKESITDTSKGWIVEDIFPEAEEIRTEIVDERRWSKTKVTYFKYKNLYFAASWDDPSTEMQDGQDTNLEINPVNPVKKEVIDFE